MADRKVTISVETTADTKGLDATNQKLDDLGKKAEDGGKKSKGAAEGTKQVGNAAGRAAELVGSLTGAMGANSPAAAQMGAGIRVLKSLIEGSSAGVMGLATVIVGIGISAWTAYQKKIEESKKKMAELLDQLTESKIETGKQRIEGIADAFGRVEKAISAARAAQSELAAAWQDLNKAGQEVTDMELQRREKEELSRVAPGDEAGATAVKNRYAQIRESGAVSRREGDAVRAEQAARDDLETAAARRINIEETLKTSESARDVIAAQLDRSKGRADTVNPDQEDRKRAAKEVAEFTAQLVQLNKTVNDLNDSLGEAKTKERAAGISLQAAQVRGSRGVEAATALAAQNASDLDRDTAKARWGQTLGDLRSRASKVSTAWSATANEYRARSDAYDPQSRDYHDQGEWNKARQYDKRLDSAAKGAEKQAAAAEKLLQQLEKTPPDKLAAVLNTIARQLQALERGLTDVEARAKRPGSGG